MDGYIIADMMMMQLGSFQFGISTAAYQELTRSTKFRWPGHDRLGQSPTLQYTGPEAETITLTGAVYPEFRGGGGQIEELRDLAATGPHQMIDGTGSVMGRWVIEGVDEKQSVFAAGGLPRKQEFTLNLKRFPDSDEINSILAFANSVAAASGLTGNAAPAALAAAKGAASLAGGAFGSLGAVVAQVQTVGGAALQALGPLRQAMTLASSIKTTALNTVRVIESAGTITTLAGAQGVMANLIRVSGTAAATATSGSNVLKSLGVDLAANGEPAPVLAAVQSSLLQVNRLAILATSIRASSDKIVRTLS